MGLAGPKVQCGQLPVQESRVGSFPKVGVPFLGTLIIRIIIFWGLYRVPRILGDYHLDFFVQSSATMGGEFQREHDLVYTSAAG